MKSIDAIFKFGHLYDRETQKRIIIEDGAQVSIVIQPESLLEEDTSVAQKKDMPLAPNEKLTELKNKLGEENPFWKIMNANDHPFFNIKGYIPKRDGKEPFDLKFRLNLLEDLYIYKSKGQRKVAKLYPCKCIIDKCLTNGFSFFEPVYGDSLNKARTKLHELYFSRVVNPASNAFREFYLYENTEEPPNLESIRKSTQKNRSDYYKDEANYIVRLT